MSAIDPLREQVEKFRSKYGVHLQFDCVEPNAATALRVIEPFFDTLLVAISE